MVKSKKNILFFLSRIPKDIEDRLLFVFFYVSLITFVIIRLITVLLFFQSKNSDNCASIACPDMSKKYFSQLPLSIKIMELSRPLGGTLSLMIIEILILIINGKFKKIMKYLIYGVVTLCSFKTFISIIEVGSNIDGGKYIATVLINTLNFTNSFFIILETVILYSTVLLSYYRNQICLNDNFLCKNKNLNSLKQESMKENEKSSKEDSSVTTSSEEEEKK
uniref:Uncharacterized protein n=1 Tax=Strongyloides stercoralis TaxID=6248 RepID=A0AAF5D754_STRER